MDYEEALDLVGGCGRYQLLLFCLLGVMISKAAVDIQVLVMAAYAPPSSCIHPYNSALNNASDSCQLAGNYSCSKWTFDNSTMTRTMVTEFDLVCDSAYLMPLFQTLVLVGIGVGRLFGLMGDVIGRRKILVIFGGFDIVMTVIQAFVPTLEAQFFLRIFRGFGDSLVFTCCYYMLEIVSTPYRMNIGCNFWIFYCLGYAGSALLGKFIQDWRYVQASSLYVLPIYVALLFLMPESPRWLLVKGRKNEAVAVMRRIARLNGKTEVTMGKLEDIQVEKEVNTGRFQDSFSSRTMASKTLVMAVIMWTCNFAYFGLILDASFASDDIFLNMGAMGLIEILGSPIAWIIGDKLGRRLPSFVLVVLSGVIILTVPHLPKGNLFWLRTTVAIAGKLVLTTGYCIVAVYVSELQPTCIRNVSLLPTIVVTSAGGILAPFVLHLASVRFWLPSVVFGGSCLVGALSLLVLPETVNLPLTQTIPEANLLVRGEESKFQERLDELRGRLTNGTEMEEKGKEGDPII